MPFTGRSVLITGGGSGLGRACARRFVAEGATVALLGRRPEVLTAAAAALRDEHPGAEVLTFAGDVTQEDDVAAAVAATVDRAPLRAVVHAAGQGWADPLAALELEHWRLVVEVNLTGCFLLLKHSAPALADAGGGTVTAISP